MYMSYESCALLVLIFCTSLQEMFQRARADFCTKARKMVTSGHLSKSMTNRVLRLVHETLMDLSPVYQQQAKGRKRPFPSTWEAVRVHSRHSCSRFPCRSSEERVRFHVPYEPCLTLCLHDMNVALLRNVAYLSRISPCAQLMDPDNRIRTNIVEYIMCPSDKCYTMHEPPSVARYQRVLLGGQRRWVYVDPLKSECGTKAFTGDEVCKLPLLKSVSEKLAWVTEDESHQVPHV